MTAYYTPAPVVTSYYTPAPVVTSYYTAPAVSYYAPSSVVTYRYVPERGDADDFNRRLLNSVLRDGRMVISATQLDEMW